MAMPKKIAGVKTPVAIAALTLLVVGFLYLRHRNSVQGSSAAPLASTADTGLGAGGGAVSTPSDNGLGSTTVGTDATQTQQLWDTLLSAYAISAQANADMAAHAGTYTNYITTTTFNSTSTPSTGNAGVTLPGGYSVPAPAFQNGIGGTGSGFSSPSANVGGEGTGPGAAGTGVSTYGTVRGGGTVRAS